MWWVLLIALSLWPIKPLTPFYDRAEELNTAPHLVKTSKEPVFSVWVRPPIPENDLYAMNTVAALAKISSRPYRIYTDSPQHLLRRILTATHPLPALETYAQI